MSNGVEDIRDQKRECRIPSGEKNSNRQASPSQGISGIQGPCNLRYGGMAPWRRCKDLQPIRKNVYFLLLYPNHRIIQSQWLERAGSPGVSMSNLRVCWLGLMVLGVGFLQASGQLTFTSIAIPSQGFTGIEGINSAGDMVGYYAKHNTGEGPWHSFVIRGGVFTFFDYPEADSTYATAINDSGLIAGSAGFKTGILVEGFLYDGTTFTPFRQGKSSATYVFGMDNAGDMVGGAGTIYTTKGFELRGRKFKNLTPPGTYDYVFATAANSIGQVVGWTLDGLYRHGFLYDGVTFQAIDYPGASSTAVTGINDNGVIVGWYSVGSANYGFTLTDGQFSSFSYPGAIATLPRAVNGAGQIVGEYTFEYTYYYGFVTTPVDSPAGGGKYRHKSSSSEEAGLVEGSR